MSQKKQKRPRRKSMARRKTEFSRAFSAAKAVLSSKMRRRTALLKELQSLNVDIPNLERTVRALNAQLGGTGPDSRPTSQTVGKQVGEVPPTPQKVDLGVMGIMNLDDIPPEIRAQLPPEDLSGMSSHFGDGVNESEDYLPPIEGKDLLREEKK